MRDWNSAKSIPASRYAWFVAYLWGIETVDRLAGLGHYGVFVAYLWGIETSF